jgi:regulatory subunit for Cdc7p protein kinase
MISKMYVLPYSLFLTLIVYRKHVAGRRHKKFAGDDANFLQLDCALARVQRRTRQEIREQQQIREERRRFYCGNEHGEVALSSDDLQFPIHSQVRRKAQVNDAEM